MRLFLSIKYYPDMRNRELIESISGALEQAGHDVVCVVRDLEKWGEISFTPAELMAKTFSIIEECDAVIIELSSKGVGLGIEAGYAHAKGIPVITIAEEGSDISATLQGISTEVELYSSVEEIPTLLSDLALRESGF